MKFKRNTKKEEEEEEEEERTPSMDSNSLKELLCSDANGSPSYGVIHALNQKVAN